MAGWGLMWGLAFALFFGCKWLSWSRSGARAHPARHLAYLLAWPGLDAEAFLEGVSPHRVNTNEVVQGLLLTASGLASFWLIGRLIQPWSDYLAGWAGMIGFVLFLHFGVSSFFSAFWRARGVDAKPLMIEPTASRSLAEFWGKRWNTAFRDLTHRFLFVPLSQRVGPRLSILIGFAFSGVVHDLVISLPAGGGYGLPTLFFLIQGLSLMFERTRLGRRLRGRTWCLLALGPPALLLFHPPFVHHVVLPFMQACGALPG